MKIVYYPPWRKQFFFCWQGASDEVLTSIYQPFHWLTRISWFIWKKSKVIRSFCTVKEHALPIPVDFLRSEFNDFDNWLWVINKGTIAPEQKQSAILICSKSKEKCFIKFADNDLAKKLLNNEISVLESLRGSGLTPQLHKKGLYKNALFFTSELITGKRWVQFEIDGNILQLLIKINCSRSYVDNLTNLIFTFNHGDFCPWNLIIKEKKLFAIDWERAGDEILGYDLFTYIFYTQFLLFSLKPSTLIMKQNIEWINSYFLHFNITDWQPYLNYFSQIRIEETNSITMKNKFKKLMK